VRAAREWFLIPQLANSRFLAPSRSATENTTEFRLPLRRRARGKAAGAFVFPSRTEVTLN
jgi:hypothetical protein